MLEAFLRRTLGSAKGRHGAPDAIGLVEDRMRAGLGTRRAPSRQGRASPADGHRKRPRRRGTRTRRLASKRRLSGEAVTAFSARLRGEAISPFASSCGTATGKKDRRPNGDTVPRLPYVVPGNA